ncbi:MAG TPA: PilN domain-containing protein [Candidatus Saccharimonadales bacterium]|nr:PilN domain-containing protein [Candidatus Saccharimonadales bacterium]
MPDTKMDVVKASRTRNTIVSIAFLVSAASVAIFLLLLFTVYLVQNKQLSDANKDIEAANAKLKSINSLEKILTVQKQLGTLPGLHQNKHISSRLFSYLPQVTPTNVSITHLTIDTENNQLKISGDANSQHAVNTFADTLKFTTYTVNKGDDQKQAFPTVVESEFALSGATDKQVTYTLDVTYDPALFSGSQAAPTLQVPTLTTTRSVLDDPNNQLFTGQTKKEEN